MELEKIEGGVTAPKGFRATGVSCGLKEGGYKDLGLIYSEIPCDVVGAFTSNKVKAAPVRLSMMRMGNKISAVIANSGNANCVTGKQGESDAIRMTGLTEQFLELPEGSALVASTGVIGENLTMDRVEYGIEKVCRMIKSENNVANFANAIMTTDTRQKNHACEFKLGESTVRIGITCKGAGMIKPDVQMFHATMLVFITTDISMQKTLLHDALKEALEYSFNRISVDNDTSTNDTVLLLSNGAAENAVIEEENDDYRVFVKALTELCMASAKAVVKDGEGANKIVKVEIKHALTISDAKKIARAIADSYLVKTAVFGNSPNWGRVLAAIGYSDAKFDIDRLIFSINGFAVLEKGEPNRANIAKASAEMIQNEITFTVDLGVGYKEYYVWTCDLSYDYVKINAHYIS
ncbi:MAG: bifunctional ornithine acetyltransferase/N-acetylglutamate synthase [Spirochaetes bacterium GWF1_51_8]|nr:MAG: bifunctional ornithine acetyltransferase/N-acetylglutamate synthase [Spirochaetes bacterium GWF1_51_8]